MTSCPDAIEVIILSLKITKHSERTNSYLDKVLYKYLSCCKPCDLFFLLPVHTYNVNLNEDSIALVGIH